jgi:hypothetical protein
MEEAGNCYGSHKIWNILHFEVHESGDIASHPELDHEISATVLLNGLRDITELFVVFNIYVN